jgi:hypothetical protein
MVVFIFVTQLAHKATLDHRGVWIDLQTKSQLEDDRVREAVNSLVEDRFTGEEGKILQHNVEKLEKRIEKLERQDVQRLNNQNTNKKAD